MKTTTGERFERRRQATKPKRTMDFWSKDNEDQLQAAIDRTLVPSYRVNNRIVHGISAAMLIDTLHNARPGWFNIGRDNMDFRNRIRSLGFAIDEGKIIGRHTPALVIYRRE